MKTPIDIIIKAKKEMNQNDFCDWLEETLPIFKDLEKSHITKAHLSGGLNRLTNKNTCIVSSGFRLHCLHDNSLCANCIVN